MKHCITLVAISDYISDTIYQTSTKTKLQRNYSSKGSTLNEIKPFLGSGTWLKLDPVCPSSPQVI